MTIGEQFDEWLSSQALHGVCMGGYTPEEEALARAAWHASTDRWEQSMRYAWEVAHLYSSGRGALSVVRDEYRKISEAWVVSGGLPAPVKSWKERSFDEACEAVTMEILGKDRDPSPGIDWICARDWKVSDVRKLVRSAMLKATDPKQE